MSGYNSRKRKASSRTSGNGRPGSGTTSGRTVHPGTGRGTAIPVNGDLAEYQRGHVPVDDSTVSGLADPSNPFLQGWMPSTNSSFPGVFDATSRRSFDDVLAEFSQTGDIQNTLAMLGFGDWQSLDKSQVQDWNKQLLEQLLKYILELEKRKYNEAMLQDQRLYDNAQNQLARLMGAGISRDAALQLLGENQQPIQTEGTTPAEGPAPSESMAREVEAKQRTFNTAISAVGTVASAFGGLASFGMSAATSVVQMAATRAATANTFLNNEQLKKTLNGIDVASTVIGALSSYESTGKALPEFKSVQSMLSFVRSNISNYEPFRALDESGALGKIPNDIYSLNALNDGYMNWRKSKDYGIDRDHIVKMQGITELRGAVDVELAESEIEENYANIDVMIGQLWNDNLRTQAQVNLMEQQTIEQQYQNTILKVDADFYGANAAALNGMRLKQLMFDAACWDQFAGDPGLYQKAIKGWLDNKDNAATAAALESIYLGDEYRIQSNLHSDNPIKSSGKGLRNIALWWHNLTREALGAPSSSQEDIEQYGSFAKSAVMMYLFKKP